MRVEHDALDGAAGRQRRVHGRVDLAGDGGVDVNGQVVALVAAVGERAAGDELDVIVARRHALRAVRAVRVSPRFGEAETAALRHDADAAERLAVRIGDRPRQRAVELHDGVDVRRHLALVDSDRAGIGKRSERPAVAAAGAEVHLVASLAQPDQPVGPVGRGGGLGRRRSSAQRTHPRRCQRAWRLSVSLTVPEIVPPSFTKAVTPEVTLPLVTATGLGNSTGR